MRGLCSFFVFVTAAALSHTAFAEESQAREDGERNETLVDLLWGGGNWTVSGSAVAHVTRLAQTGTSLVGGRLGFLRKRGEHLGVGVFLTPSSIDFPKSGQPAKLKFQYWGISMGHEENNRDLIQSYGHLFVGMASAELRQPSGEVERDSSMFVTEPEMGLALKVTSWMRLGVGFSWRGVWGGNLAHTHSRTFDAWSTALSLSLGNYEATCRNCDSAR